MEAWFIMTFFPLPLRGGELQSSLFIGGFKKQVEENECAAVIVCNGANNGILRTA